MQEHNASIERRDAWRGVAVLALGGAVLAGVTGLFLFMFDEPSLAAPSRAEQPDREAPEQEQPARPATMEIGAAPCWFPGGAGASLVGRF